MEIKFNFVSRTPKNGGSPNVLIKNHNKKNNYKIQFLDCFGLVVKSVEGVTLSGDFQYPHIQYINVFENGKLVFNEKFNLKNKNVYIKFDSYALGDTVAWMGYVDLFSRLYGCNLICSTFFNDLFIDSYPNILFVKPNTHIDNLYCQFYIGANEENNINYSRINSKKNNLQLVAKDILGIRGNDEVKPLISYEKIDLNLPDKYVCISEFASDEIKMWREDNGWQLVVNYLNSIGVSVVVISKEKTKLKEVIDLSGDEYDLNHRINTLKNSLFFIGVSSGLSWLAWGVGVKVILISDVTPLNHEFFKDCKRLGDPELKEVNYNNNYVTKIDKVYSTIDHLME